MKALRLILPLGDTQYTVRQVGAIVGHEFPDQKIVDVLLNSPEDIDAARRFVAGFQDGVEENVRSGFRSELRNGPNAVTVRDAFVVDVYHPTSPAPQQNQEIDSTVSVNRSFATGQHWGDVSGRHLRLIEPAKRKEPSLGPRGQGGEWLAYELGDLGTASVIVSEAELVSLLFESEKTEDDS